MDFGNIAQYLMPCIMIGVVLVVIFTELVKKIDKNNRLKGRMVYIPALLSLLLSAIMGFGDFFPLKQIPFYWAVIFGVSVFGYETILKRLTRARDENTTQ
jgi:hypothetical protein